MKSPASMKSPPLHAADPVRAAADAQTDHGPAWRVAIGCAIGLAVAFGPALIASFGLYVKPIAAQFGWSRTQVALAFSIFSIMGAFGTPLLGIVLDRHGSRPVLLSSVIVLPLALALLVLVPPSYPAFLGWAVVVGLVAIVASPAAYINLLPQWFNRRLGLAVSLAMTGSGLGQALFTMGHGLLLSHLAWRQAWLIMAGVVAAVGIVNAVTLLRDRHDLVALRRAGRHSDLPGDPPSVALRSSAFWFATAAFFIVMLVIGAMLTHLVALLTDRGMSVGQAAMIAATIGFSSLVGRLLTGLVVDRVGFGLMGVITFPLQAAGCVLLIAGHSVASAWLAAGLIGLTYGVEADLLPFMLRRTFGLRCFGQLYGLAFGIVQLGPVLGPILIGASFDRLGSYDPGLAVLAVLSLLSAVLVALADRQARTVGMLRRSAHRPGMTGGQVDAA